MMLSLEMNRLLLDSNIKAAVIVILISEKELKVKKAWTQLETLTFVNIYVIIYFTDYTILLLQNSIYTVF